MPKKLKQEKPIKSNIMSAPESQTKQRKLQKKRSYVSKAEKKLPGIIMKTIKANFDDFTDSSISWYLEQINKNSSFDT